MHSNGPQETSGSSDTPSNSEHTSETAAKSPSPMEPGGRDDMDTAEPDDSMRAGTHLPCNQSTAG